MSLSILALCTSISNAQTSGGGPFTHSSTLSVTDGTNICYPYQIVVGSNSCSSGIATINGGLSSFWAASGADISNTNSGNVNINGNMQINAGSSTGNFLIPSHIYLSRQGNGQIAMSAGIPVGWSSGVIGNTFTSQTLDAEIRRASSGRLAIDTGTVGAYGDLQLRTLILGNNSQLIDGGDHLNIERGNTGYPGYFIDLLDGFGADMVNFGGYGPTGGGLLFFQATPPTNQSARSAFVEMDGTPLIGQGFKEMYWGASSVNEYFNGAAPNGLLSTEQFGRDSCLITDTGGGTIVGDGNCKFTTDFYLVSMGQSEIYVVVDTANSNTSTVVSVTDDNHMQLAGAIGSTGDNFTWAASDNIYTIGPIRTTSTLFGAKFSTDGGLVNTDGSGDLTASTVTASSTNTAALIANSIVNNSGGTIKSCATSGTVTWYQTMSGTGRKEVMGYANACLGASASFTFSSSFAHTPAVMTTNQLSSTLLSTLTTTTVVLTGTTSTGYIFIEGN